MQTALKTLLSRVYDLEKEAEAAELTARAAAAATAAGTSGETAGEGRPFDGIVLCVLGSRLEVKQICLSVC